MERPIGKKTMRRTENHLYFRSFSVVFQQLVELIHDCLNRQLRENWVSLSKSHSVPSVSFRLFRCFSSLDLLLVLQIKDTSVLLVSGFATAGRSWTLGPDESADLCN